MTKIINKIFCLNEGVNNIFLLVLISISILLSCKKNDQNIKIYDKTVIVYMIADNNLDVFSVDDINEMEEGWKDCNGKLIVYLDRAEGASPSHPLIYEITHDNSNDIKSKIIKVYNEQNSTDKLVMRSILNEIIQIYPSTKYGLILWSHGSAWLPKGINLSKNIKSYNKKIVKSFGKDHEEEMNITDLAESLNLNEKFDFILFDACYMGSIEVLYELQSFCDYFICSPAEILTYGFPYKTITPLLFDLHPDYQKIAQKHYEFYQNQAGIYQSGTISVLKSDELPSLCDIFSNQLKSNLKKTNNYIKNIQQYEISKNNILFDFKEFMDSISENPLNSNQLKKYENSFIYRNCTNKILDELVINNYSGLSVFIPDSTNINLHESYKKTKWYNASNYYLYFNNFSF